MFEPDTKSIEHKNTVSTIVKQIPTYKLAFKRLRIACTYNNAYRIIYYIPRNVSVHSHQVDHCVRTFGGLFRNYLYGFVRRRESSSKFFIRSLQRSDAFHKPLFSSII